MSAEKFVGQFIASYNAYDFFNQLIRNHAFTLPWDDFLFYWKIGYIKDFILTANLTIVTSPLPYKPFARVSTT